jgi:DNA (cytosine-5)-methyltransferase 1
MPYDLTQEQRDRYRATSIRSQQRKQALLRDHAFDVDPVASIHTHRLDPNDLMPQLEANHLHCLSLFSGGGGLDLGFERAGFGHVAAYELLEICGQSLRQNRPAWDVHSGEIEGDVARAAFTPFRGVDVGAPSMGAILEVQVLPRADHSERSEVQLREGDRAWRGST